MMVYRKLNYVLLAVFLIVLLFPIIYMISSSFKTTQGMFEYPFRFVSDTFTFVNYVKAWDSPVKTFMGNSLLIAFLCLVCNILFSSLAGYAFSMYSFRGKTVIFAFVILTTIVPFDYNIIPLYILVKKAHLLNTYFGIALPNLITSVGIFMMAQFSKEMPKELLESARMDGSSEYRTFFHIALPLLLPGIAVLGIFTILDSWESLLWPIVSVTKSSMYPVAVGIAYFTGDSRYLDYPALMAALVISILPVVILFIPFQKRIMDTQLATGIKG